MTVAVRTSVTLTGDVFERMADGLRDLRPFMQDVGAYMLQKSTDRTLGGHFAKPTGALASSIAIFEVTSDSVSVGSNRVYAGIQNVGGTIFPKTQKALAIPLTARLKRDGDWPRDVDPSREKLTFIPYKGPRPNIFGLLVDKEGKTEYGPGPLFALARWVDIEAKPYLFVDDADLDFITGKLFTDYMERLS